MGKVKNAIKSALPAVLTIIGSAATVGAVFLAAKEGPKFKETTEEKEMKTGEKILTGAKIFAPAIGCAALSIVCSVGAHMMDKKTQASLMGAYAVLNEGYKKYKAKNAELHGEDADLDVMRAIEEEKLPEEAMDLDDDKTCTVHLKNLCDDIPEMTFMSSKYAVLDMIVRVNRLIDAVESVTVNDLLNLLDRDPIKDGDDVGWSYDMLWRDCRTTFLNFIVEYEEDGSLTVAPQYPANGGFLIDFGLNEI